MIGLWPEDGSVRRICVDMEYGAFSCRLPSVLAVPRRLAGRGCGDCAIQPNSADPHETVQKVTFLCTVEQERGELANNINGLVATFCAYFGQSA
jgi:hypothetical protein